MLKNPEIKNLQVIDVREANELSMAKLHDNRMVNLPLSGINDWLSKLSHGTMLHKTAPTVVYCHHGIRSMNAATHIGKCSYHHHCRIWVTVHFHS